MLDYAFTALGLRNVALTVFPVNPTGSRGIALWPLSGALHIHPAPLYVDSTLGQRGA